MTLRDSDRWPLRGGYLYLCAALLALACAYPLLGYGVPGLATWTVAFWVVLLGVLHAIGTDPHMRRLARTLAAVAVAAGVASLACYNLSRSSHGWIFAITDGLTLLFLLLATGAILVDVLFREAIDLDHLLGAACAYVMLGLTFAYVLSALDALTAAPMLTHGESTDLGPTVAPGLAQAEFLYFSFVTLSTLGYGDLAPATLPARLVAGAESIMGQLFLTILVARLIGLHLARRGGAELQER